MERIAGVRDEGRRRLPLGKVKIQNLRTRGRLEVQHQRATRNNTEDKERDND